MNYRRKIVALLICLQMLAGSRARASILSDVGESLANVIGLRGFVRGALGGASEKFKEDASRLIDEKISPLLDRADAIVHSNVDNAANQAMQLVKTAEIALNEILSHAQMVGDGLIAKFFLDLQKTLDEAMNRLIPLVDDALCAIAPDRDGIRIKGIPFVKQYAEVKIKYPARTHCYRDFVLSNDDPVIANFSGYQYFLGEICELELRANRVEPSDPRSIKKMARAYEQLAGMAKAAMCSAPTGSERKIMINRELFYEGRAEFFRGIETGTSRIIPQRHKAN